MGTNFHTAFTSASGLDEDTLNLPHSAVDRAVSYIKNPIVHCDGEVRCNPLTGVLVWTGVLRIIFNRSDGQACTNLAAAGFCILDDNEFAYVDLSETNGATVTVGTAEVSAGSASNFLAYNRVVLAYRNAASDSIFPVHLFPETVLREAVADLELARFQVFQPDKPANSAVLLCMPMTRAVEFPVDLDESQVAAGTAATAETVFSAKKNDVEFGTITFAAAGTVATFTAASATSFAVGDVLTVVAPASADATLADIGGELVGTITFSTEYGGS